MIVFLSLTRAFMGSVDRTGKYKEMRKESLDFQVQSHRRWWRPWKVLALLLVSLVAVGLWLQLSASQFLTLSSFARYWCRHLPWKSQKGVLISLPSSQSPRSTLTFPSLLNSSFAEVVCCMAVAKTRGVWTRRLGFWGLLLVQRNGEHDDSGQGTQLIDYFPWYDPAASLLLTGALQVTIYPLFLLFLMS